MLRRGRGAQGEGVTVSQNIAFQQGPDPKRGRFKKKGGTRVKSNARTPAELKHAAQSRKVPKSITSNLGGEESRTVKKTQSKGQQDISERPIKERGTSKEKTPNVTNGTRWGKVERPPT